METSSIVDVHVHLAALPEGENGCFISPKMLGSPLFRLVAWRLGLPVDEPAKANAIYIEKLLGHLNASQHVRRAVILGMDGVYDEQGVLDRRKTEFLIANDYVLRVARDHPDHFLAGVSVNPQRRDAVEELERVAAGGAALVKVLPNTLQFDPSREAYRAYYRGLARLKLPLLSHVGFEFSLIGHDQSVGDVDRLRMALEEGVTVIAAHGASTGLFLYEKHWATLREFVRRYPHFYWDASALTLPNRVGMLFKLRKHPELIERMLFGTDYPLPVFAYPALRSARPGAYRAARSAASPFDRQYEVLTGLGMIPGVFPLWEKKNGSH